MSQTGSGENSPAPKKGKKKKKEVKMDLHSFLSDKSSGVNYNKDPPKNSAPSSNWADATEDIDPAEITTSWPEEKQMFDRSVLPSAPRASSAIQLDMSRLPPNPPYTVYLGNISYECTGDDIVKFFERRKLVATSVRLPMDQGTSRMKGFGYAEFGSIEDLKEALSLDKELLRNRPVQINLAGDREHSHGGGRGRREQEDDRTTGNWRRGGDDFPGSSPPGYDRDDRRHGRPRYGSRDGPMDRGRDFGPREGHRDSYGSRDDGYGPPYDSRDGGYRPPRDGHRDSYDSRDGGYRDSRDGYGGRGRYGSGDYDRNDRGYDRGPRNRGFGDGWGGDDRRGGRYGDRGRYDDRRGGYGGRPGGEEPVERPRIKLQPRSKPLDDITPTEEQSKNSSIFGDAKPVDTAAKEREIEERKARELEEKERLAKERQEKNAALFGGAKPVDTSAREREIEEKMARKQEQLERKISQEQEREKTPDQPEQQRNKTPEAQESSRDRREDQDIRESASNEKGPRGGRRRISSSEDEGKRGNQSSRRRDEGSRDNAEQRSSAGRGDNRRRGGGPRRDGRDDRRSNDRGDSREYNDRGGRGRGRGNYRRDDRPREDRDRARDDRPREDRDRTRNERPRDDRREDDRKGGKAPNAWSKGKPRSLGGVDQRKVLEDTEPVTFSQPSRYASLQDENDSGEEAPATTRDPTTSEN